MYSLIFSVILIPSGLLTTTIEHGFTRTECEARLDRLTNAVADDAERAGLEVAIQGECQPVC